MFWDSSAVVPILLAESRSAELRRVLADDREVTIWWTTSVECQSALHRRHREGKLSTRQLRSALTRLNAFVADADVVDPAETVRLRAGRVLSTHALRAADALQLAAALIWCEEKTSGEVVVCLDDRLREAAGREGFDLVPTD